MKADRKMNECKRISCECERILCESGRFMFVRDNPINVKAFYRNLPKMFRCESIY